MAHPVRSRLQVEFLEAREVPDGSPSETFDTLTPPNLPSGWDRWSSDATPVFTTAVGTGVDGSNALVSSAGSRTAGLTWTGTPVDGDSGVAISLKADTLVPAFVFGRGLGFEHQHPELPGRGGHARYSRSSSPGANGVTTVLGSVASPGSAYLSGQWVRVTLVPTGNSVAVRVVRADTGQYLNTNGTWQAAETAVITRATTLSAANGLAGVGRAALYAGAVNLDNFAVVLPTPVSIAQSFDSTAIGAIPAGWQTWLAGRLARLVWPIAAPSARRTASPPPADPQPRRGPGRPMICPPMSRPRPRSISTASFRRIFVRGRTSIPPRQRITPPPSRAG